MMMADADQQDELLMLGPADERVDQHGSAARSRRRRTRPAIGTSASSGSSLKRREQHVGRIHGDHGELAMGEIDDPHHAEDHRQAERHQPVDEPGQHALDHDVEIDRPHGRAGKPSGLRAALPQVPLVLNPGARSTGTRPAPSLGRGWPGRGSRAAGAVPRRVRGPPTYREGAGEPAEGDQLVRSDTKRSAQ